MLLRNFTYQCASDLAVANLAQGFLVLECNGDMVAAIESLPASWGFASSCNQNDMIVNVHFPNGEYLAGADIGDYDDFEEVARRLDYLAVCEEMDDLPELVETLIVETREDLDIRRG